MELKSERINVADALDAVELFFNRRWTDGLAIVPPTEEKVIQMIQYVRRDPGEVLGEIPPFGGLATLEKLAINSVMAGCLPEYFPVVIAAVEAMLDPVHKLNGTQTTQGGAEQLIIVNGPIVKKLGINFGEGVFGRGFRANGTIGRAIRLILWNLGQNFPGEVDKSILSHPGAWSFCIAEDEDGSPWEPLHVERGLAPGSDAVTVLCCDAPQTVLTYGSVRQMLSAICGAMMNPGANNYMFMNGEVLVVLTRFIAEQFRAEGWTKRDVKMRIWENARVPYWKLEDTGLITSLHRGGTNLAERCWPKWIDRSNPDTLVPITVGPEKIHVVVCGGAGISCAVLYGWGHGGWAVTKKIRTE